MTGEVGIKTEDNVTRVQATAIKRTNNVDTTLNLDTQVSAQKFIFKAPDKVVTTVTGTTLVAADGTFFFDTATTFFTMNRGEWQVQAQYTLTGTGAILHSNVKRFNVGETLGA